MVAISGGPDSVGLLSILHHLRSHWKLTLTAIHCNYGLRGAESDEDQRFVEALCLSLVVPLHVRRAHIQTDRRTASLQAEARDIRYRLMQEIRTMSGADRIAVGHTADDQAETVLLWMLRGAGLTGLSGMPAVRDDAVVRPLYETTRREILTYLRTAGVSYREDSSNAKPLYLRNRIRQEVIPLLTQLVPSSSKALCRLADLCRADDHYLDQEVAVRTASAVKWGTTGAWTLDRRTLADLPLPLQRRCLRLLLRRSDPHQRAPSFHKIERVRRLVSSPESDCRVAIKGGVIVVTMQTLRFIPFPAGHREDRRHRDADAPHTPISIPGELIWPGTGQRLQVQLQEYDPREPVPEQDQILVDADRITHALTIRSWVPGDRFCPRGMGGHSKKLQDFFTDMKIPMARRDRVPLVVAPEGILWIVGYRQDERWVPTSLTTRCLVITVTSPPLTEGTD
ncbi:tRNA lysidine(34) synthetase TilS [Nitrospira sp. BLG_1]|uniref:tRNA lysidine(34) synthetase TilS n=1 Tax=Nitrospira sp. BLG_1 TaxID=3395883 RepID=UPI0039BCF4D2